MRLLDETLSNPQLTQFIDRGFLYYQVRTGPRYSQDHYLARRYALEEYPSLLLVNDREEIIWQYEGFLSASELMYKLAHFLPGSPMFTAAFPNPVQTQARILIAQDMSLPGNQPATGTMEEDFIITDNLNEVETVDLIPTAPTAIQPATPPVPVMLPIPQPAAYGLIIQTDKDPLVIQQSARRWKLVWAGDIWIKQLENGSTGLILGSIQSEKAARNKRLELRKRNGIRAKVIHFPQQETALSPTLY